MSEVTIIGLGLMGSAIANTFQKSGLPITVWNRSKQKAAMLENEGVTVARTINDAVLASPVIIICVDDPNSVFTILGPGQTEPLLDGRTIVQLSTCLPRQARDAEEWLTARNARFLVGAIHCGPADLGSEGGHLLISGHFEAFQPIAPLIDLLGGKIEYLGENIAAASVLDLAWLSTRFGRFMGMLHASNICLSEGVEIDRFMSLFPDDAQIQHHVGTIRDNAYDQRSATLSVWQASLELLKEHALDAGINSEFPDHVGQLFEKAIEAGYGEEHVMALFKILRNTS